MIWAMTAASAARGRRAQLWREGGARGRGAGRRSAGAAWPGGARARWFVLRRTEGGGRRRRHCGDCCPTWPVAGRRGPTRSQTGAGRRCRVGPRTEQTLGCWGTSGAQTVQGTALQGFLERRWQGALARLTAAAGTGDTGRSSCCASWKDAGSLTARRSVLRW